MKTNFASKARRAGLAAAIGLGLGLNPLGGTAAEAYVHTGIFYTDADFQQVREQLRCGQQPWREAWEIGTRNQWAAKDYKPQPVAAPTRSILTKHGDSEMFSDSYAALEQAIMSRVSPDAEERARCRAKAEEILDAWANKVDTRIGGGEPQLLAGICGYKFAAAADIVREDRDWVKRGGLEKVASMLKKYFVPTCQDFLATHWGMDNGAQYPYYYRGNQDLAAIITIMATGILTDDTRLYEEALQELKDGKTNARMRHYLFPTSDPFLAQGEESGRDQAHAQLGIGLLSAIAQASYVQHLADSSIENLFEYDNRLILRGSEYAAKYNLGYDDVPFQQIYTPTNNHYDPKGNRSEPVPAKKLRSEVRPVYDLIWDYYHDVDGLAGDKPGTPLYYTRQAVYGTPMRNHTDQLPFPSLMYVPEAGDRTRTVYPISLVLRGGDNKYVTVDITTGEMTASKPVAEPKQADESELFLLRYATEGSYTLEQAVTHRYVRIHGTKGKLAADEPDGSVVPARFELQEAGNGYIWLKSVETGKFVSTDKEGRLLADQEPGSGKAVQRFRIVAQNQNTNLGKARHAKAE